MIIAEVVELRVQSGAPPPFLLHLPLLRSNNMGRLGRGVPGKSWNMEANFFYGDRGFRSGKPESPDETSGLGGLLLTDTQVQSVYRAPHPSPSLHTILLSLAVTNHQHTTRIKQTYRAPIPLVFVFTLLYTYSTTAQAVDVVNRILYPSIFLVFHTDIPNNSIVPWCTLRVLLLYSRFIVLYLYSTVLYNSVL